MVGAVGGLAKLSGLLVRGGARRGPGAGAPYPRGRRTAGQVHQGLHLELVGRRSRPVGCLRLPLAALWGGALKSEPRSFRSVGGNGGECSATIPVPYLKPEALGFHLKAPTPPTWQPQSLSTARLVLWPCRSPFTGDARVYSGCPREATASRVPGGRCLRPLEPLQNVNRCVPLQAELAPCWDQRTENVLVRVGFEAEAVGVRPPELRHGVLLASLDRGLAMVAGHLPILGRLPVSVKRCYRS